MKAKPRSRERDEVAALEAVSTPTSAPVVPFTSLETLRFATFAMLARAKRGDRLAQDRLFSMAIGVSIVVHGILLAVRFVIEEDKRPVRSPPLEVVLVNSKSPNKPYKAQVLAQANLDGGGNTDQARRAKSPLPVLPKDSDSPDVASATQRVQVLENEARQLLSQTKSSTTVAVEPRKNEAVEPKQASVADKDLNQRMQEAIRLEAQIARELEAYQQRPKRRFLGARAEEYRFARYVEDWRMKVERIGNLNYPEAARSQKLYGSLLLTVGIKADGSIESIQVDKASGKKILDAAAIRIVQLAAPFSSFPPEIRRDTDILYITRTWTFARGDELISSD